MLLLDGRQVAEKIRQEIKNRAQEFTVQAGRPPGLAVVLVGNDSASEVYVKNKERACEQVGLRSWRKNLPAEISQAELNAVVQELNATDEVDGILVQFPLPSHLDKKQVLSLISPDKDADGLTALSMGRLLADEDIVQPCTPAGVMAILEHYNIHVEGARAVVVGRSAIVGKPMALLLVRANATVTLCHSRTRCLRDMTREADLVVVAAGQPQFLGREDFKSGAVVVDVGIHRLANQPGQSKPSLVGDVRFTELEGWVRAATPVPRGVGPMTITMLLKNTLTLAENRNRKR